MTIGKTKFYCNSLEEQWEDCSTCPSPCEPEKKAREKKEVKRIDESQNQSNDKKHHAN